jgi:hypothetical protein
MRPNSQQVILRNFKKRKLNTMNSITRVDRDQGRHCTVQKGNIIY